MTKSCESSFMELGPGLDVDKGHHIIVIQGQLIGSLKFPVFRRVCTGIIFEHSNYSDDDVETRFPTRERPWAPGSVGPCFKKPLQTLIESRISTVNAV
ncbi:hypothetical protein TNCV_3812741 [Trichonephila clavipes]|nr:hypothetical protein TNCV_3812741 [Trichonephila clavipes]